MTEGREITLFLAVRNAAPHSTIFLTYGAGQKQALMPFQRRLFAIECPALTTRAVLIVIVLLTAPVLIFVQAQRFAPKGDLLRDPLAVAESNPAACCEFYYGFVSTLGSFLWASSAAVCLLGWLVIRQLPGLTQHKWFFFFGFIFSSALCLDDTFMLHETVIPELGLDEKWGYAILAAISVPYLFSARFLLVRRSGLMLVAAIGFLAASALIDLTMEARFIYEDSLKFIGIVTWTVFHFSIVIEELHRRLECFGALGEIRRE